MKKILIFGFGYTGESMFDLCVSMGMDVFVLDESLSPLIRHREFITLEDVEAIGFDMALICMTNPQATLNAKEKLIKRGINEIRRVSSYAYRKSMSYLLSKYFGNQEALFEEWRREDFELEHFHHRLEELVQEHHQWKQQNSLKELSFREEVDCALPQQNIFSKLYHTKCGGANLGYGMISYPGFFVLHSKGNKEDENFYFVEEIEWEKILHRPPHVKLICVFGNSALRIEYLGDKARLTHFMRELSGSEDFIILNCGVRGYTLYEQMTLYHALFYPLKPDIVISCFGGTDFRMGFVCDETLVKRHKIVYMADLLELSYKTTMRSSIPLWSEIGKTNFDGQNPHLRDEDIVEAMVERLEQFHHSASYQSNRGESKFYAFIQPLLPCKKVWSEEEIQMEKKSRETLSTAAYQHKIIERVPKLIELLLNRSKERGINYLFDLNEAIREHQESIFTSFWIHCNARGNELCAKYMWDTLHQSKDKDRG